jgi:hypothetical protein
VGWRKSRSEDWSVCLDSDHRVNLQGYRQRYGWGGSNSVVWRWRGPAARIGDVRLRESEGPARSSDRGLPCGQNAIL